MRNKVRAGKCIWKQIVRAFLNYWVENNQILNNFLKSDAAFF